MISRLFGLAAPFALLSLTTGFVAAREPVALNATVSAADPRAAAAGQEILRRGGSATDAAIAMMLTLNVVEPHNSGIGGGGFLMHHDGATGLLESIDGRETAPAAARPDRFIGADGKPLPFVQAWPGGYSVGVPGNLRMAWDAHKKWGKLSWADLFAPALRHAENGFILGERTATALKAVQT
ncbi:MAG: gamma-glutamyltransferase, partial [bacterium]|nr:gamma-glutamyltransferase [bacterium]